MKGGAGNRSRELAEQGVEERCSATMRDEEDRLRQDRGRVLLGCCALAFVVSSAAGGGRNGFRLGGVQGLGTGEGAEVKEEVGEVDFADLRGDEDIFLGETGRGGDAVSGESVS